MLASWVRLGQLCALHHGPKVDKGLCAIVDGIDERRRDKAQHRADIDDEGALLLGKVRQEQCKEM